MFTLEHQEPCFFQGSSGANFFSPELWSLKPLWDHEEDRKQTYTWYRSCIVSGIYAYFTFIGILLRKI